MLIHPLNIFFFHKLLKIHRRGRAALLSHNGMLPFHRGAPGAAPARPGSPPWEHKQEGGCGALARP